MTPWPTFQSTSFGWSNGRGPRQRRSGPSLHTKKGKPARARAEASDGCARLPQPPTASCPLSILTPAAARLARQVGHAAFLLVLRKVLPYAAKGAAAQEASPEALWASTAAALAAATPGPESEADVMPDLLGGAANAFLHSDVLSPPADLF